MDIGLLILGTTLGFTAGLICRRNNIKVLPTYLDMDMGALGKKQYY